jgi:potassium-transporting ATPase KdpC subunit
MKKNLITAVMMTIATTILLGIVYPLVVTGLAQLIFPKQANGQLIQRAGKSVGSSIIGQGFSAPGYFHSDHRQREMPTMRQIQRAQTSGPRIKSSSTA